jgi:hypothetical protein
MLAFLETVTFLVGLCGLAAIIGISFLYGRVQRNWDAKRPRRSYAPPSKVAERIFDYAAYILIACMFYLMLFALVYLPLSSLMELGYTLLGAIVLYVGMIALLPIPLYCLGGKKLLLGTKLGEKICPVIRT